MTEAYRVMVVDDSVVIRSLLSRCLESDRSIDVVASVPNGELAVRRVASSDIEVVVLDIEMPVMDGLTALPKIIAARPGIQVIMASTLTRQNADISLRALRDGAADYVTKPSSMNELNAADAFKRSLVAKVKALGAAARARLGRSASTPGRASGAPAARAAQAAKPAGSKKIALRPAAATQPQAIAIGSSTGGPQALLALLGDLPGDLAVPIFITQHMPATFTTLLAEHISRASPIHCHEAEDSQIVAPGQAYLAPGDYHMEVVAEGGAKVIKLNQGPQENFCRPAVDPMIRSLSRLYGRNLLVVILTGMGADGQRGAEAVVAAGGAVIAQDESTSVVWGMPGAVATAGLCSAVLPLQQLAPHMRNLLLRSAA